MTVPLPFDSQAPGPTLLYPDVACAELDLYDISGLLGLAFDGALLTWIVELVHS